MSYVFELKQIHRVQSRNLSEERHLALAVKHLFIQCLDMEDVEGLKADMVEPGKGFLQYERRVGCC